MRKRITVIAVTLGLLLGGGAIAIAQTDIKPNVEVRPAKPDGAERRAKPDAEGRKRLPGKGAKHFGPGISHAIHGEVIVPVRPAEGSAADAATTFETVEFDRGKVVSATDDSLTLERPDGVKVTLKLDDATRIRGASKGSELTVGAPVMVLSKDGVARQVGQPKARQAAPRKARPA